MEVPMSLSSLLDWFAVKRVPRMSRRLAVEMMNLSHPKTLFLKTLPLGANVLDMGAGDGTMSILRDWPQPSRKDLQLYAVSLEKGVHFDKYAGYSLANWEDGPPAFPSVAFSAAICSHFIEHISRPLDFLSWISDILVPGGRIYLEWPTPESLTLPPKGAFAEHGITLSISNFRDDATHLSIPDRSEVSSVLTRRDFRVEAQGVVRLPVFEDELLAHFLGNADDPYAVQLAFWSKTRWAQYVIAERNQHG